MTTKMDSASRPSGTATSTNGQPPIVVTKEQGAPGPQRTLTNPIRSPSQDKRYSLLPQPVTSVPPAPQKREANSLKKSGFGIFGRSRDEDDEREQLKKLKAENKLLREKYRELEVASNQMAAENERYKTNLVGERKINNQLHPDSYYSSTLERLSVGLTDWTVTHFRGKNTREYTIEMVEEIRSGLKRLSDANNLIPPALHWVDIDLQKALSDSKFRIAFVLHVVSLHLHEKVFSPFSYEIEDFGLGYWLKRISDEVARSGEHDVYFKWDWSKTLFKSIPGMFEGETVESRIVRRIKRILRPVHPRESPEDVVFEKLQEYVHNAIEIAVAMRLEQARFVSTFPIQGAAYQLARHSTGGDDQTGAIRMCTFPGIIKQAMFLGASTATDISIFRARVHLDSAFANMDWILPLPLEIEAEEAEPAGSNGVDRE